MRRSRNLWSAALLTAWGTGSAFTARISPASRTSCLPGADVLCSCMDVSGTSTQGAVKAAPRPRIVTIGSRSSSETLSGTRQWHRRCGRKDGRSSWSGSVIAGAWTSLRMLFAVFSGRLARPQRDAKRRARAGPPLRTSVLFRESGTLVLKGARRAHRFHKFQTTFQNASRSCPLSSPWRQVYHARST